MRSQAARRANCLILTRLSFNAAVVARVTGLQHGRFALHMDSTCVDEFEDRSSKTALEIGNASAQKHADDDRIGCLRTVTRTFACCSEHGGIEHVLSWIMACQVQQLILIHFLYHIAVDKGTTPLRVSLPITHVKAVVHSLEPGWFASLAMIWLDVGTRARSSPVFSWKHEDNH